MEIFISSDSAFVALDRIKVFCWARFDFGNFYLLVYLHITLVPLSLLDSTQISVPKNKYLLIKAIVIRLLIFERLEIIRHCLALCFITKYIQLIRDTSFYEETLNDHTRYAKTIKKILEGFENFMQIRPIHHRKVSIILVNTFWNSLCKTDLETCHISQVFRPRNWFSCAHVSRNSLPFPRLLDIRIFPEAFLIHSTYQYEIVRNRV